MKEWKKKFTKWSLKKIKKNFKILPLKSRIRGFFINKSPDVHPGPPSRTPMWSVFVLKIVWKEENFTYDKYLSIKHGTKMEPKKGMKWEWNSSRLKTQRTERNELDRSRLRTPRTAGHGTWMEGLERNERGRNYLAEDPRSRNDFYKVALIYA